MGFQLSLPWFAIHTLVSLFIIIITYPFSIRKVAIWSTQGHPMVLLLIFFYIDFVYLLFLCVVTVGSKCNVALSKLERERE